MYYRLLTPGLDWLRKDDEWYSFFTNRWTKTDSWDCPVMAEWMRRRVESPIIPRTGDALLMKDGTIEIYGCTDSSDPSRFFAESLSNCEISDVYENLGAL